MGNCVAGNGRVSPVPGAIIPHDFQKSEKIYLFCIVLSLLFSHNFGILIFFYNGEIMGWSHRREADRLLHQRRQKQLHSLRRSRLWHPPRSR